MKRKKENVLQCCNYSSSYKGNFINSLEHLDDLLMTSGRRNIYLFPTAAQRHEWTKAMSDAGKPIYFLSGKFMQDIILVRKIMTTHSVSIVHTHFCGSITQIVLKIASIIALRKTELIVHIHNHYSSIDSNYIKNILRKVFVFGRCIFIGCGKSVADDACHYFSPNRVFAVENAIDFSRLDKYETLCKKEFEVSQDDISCLMFGFDYYRKGVDLAIKAIELIRHDYDVVLGLVLSSNIDLVKANIVQHFGTFPDWIIIIPPRNDISTYYKAFDIFISASREEGLCYSVIEAAYCESLIVASQIPGCPKLPSVQFFLSEDENDLSNKLIEVINKRELYRKDLKKQKDYVTEKYNLDRWASEIVRIYDFKK